MLDQLAGILNSLQGVFEVQAAVRDEMMDIGIFEDISGLPGTQLEIDWYGNSAKGCNGQIGTDIFCPIAGEYAGPFSRAQSAGVSAGSRVSTAVVSRFIAQAPCYTNPSRGP